MRDDIMGYCFLIATAATSAISFIFYKRYARYRSYENEVRKESVSDVKHLLDKYEKDDQFKSSKNGKKMVFVSGVAVHTKYFHNGKSIDKMLHTIKQPPSSLVCCNPINSMIAHISSPDILTQIEEVRYKSRNAIAFSSYYAHTKSPFVVKDHHNKEILVKPNVDTELVGVRL